MKIYVVDDDPDMVILMTLLLERAGHEIASNAAGSVALPEISKFKPDCVLTDLMMAQMDGLELCRELRKMEVMADTAVIVVSARTDGYWRQRASDAGATGYITKPLDPETFASQVEEIARL